MAPPEMIRHAIIITKKNTFLIHAPTSAPERIAIATTLHLFQFIVKAQLKDKKTCKQNADNQIKDCRGMRFAGDGDKKRPRHNQTFEHKTDAYMVQVKL